MNYDLKKERAVRKLIDLRRDTKTTLQILSVKQGKDLKNFIQDELARLASEYEDNHPDGTTPETLRPLYDSARALTYREFVYQNEWMF